MWNWGKQAYIIWLSGGLFMRNPISKIKFGITHNKFVQAVEVNLNISDNLRELCEKRELTEILNLINVCQFVMICTFDTSTLIHELACSKTRWKQILHARLLALTIVEFMQDIAELTGKSFRENISQTLNSPDAINRLNIILKDLNNLRDTHDKELRDIRNVAIAHRDKNAKIQLDMINKLDINNICSLANDITKFQSSMIDFITSLLSKIADDIKKQAS